MTNLFIVWDMDPIFFSLFGFDIRWYSISWMLAFLLCITIIGRMVKREGLDPKLTDSILIYTLVSTIIGARLGHCLFYDPIHYLSNPLEILNIREGGMASHGTAIGMLVGAYLFSRRYKMPYIWILDRITAVIPLGGAFIRIGNLFNSEIYGTQTDKPWGFIFQLRGETLPMHPTQLYEAIIYFIICAILCFMYFKKNLAILKPGAITGVFLITLFSGRFIVESIKNVQVAFEETMRLNMGQILSIPFIIAGVVILVLALKGKFLTATPTPKVPNKKKTK